MLALGSTNGYQKSTKSTTFSPKIPELQQWAFLPSVRANYNHSAASCLRDCTMLLLASGRNAIQTACPYLRAYKAPHDGLSLACPR